MSRTDMPPARASEQFLKKLCSKYTKRIFTCLTLFYASQNSLTKQVEIHYFGGSKKLSDLQTDFADFVSKLGLQRAIKGSKARHTDIKKYYSLINSIVNTNPVIDIPKPKLLENKKEFGDRVAKEVIEKVSDEIKKLKIELQINKETEIKRLSKINLKVYKEDKVYIKNFEKITAENRKFYNKQDRKLNFFDDGEKIYTDFNDKYVVNDMVRLAKIKN
jgi:hypothetical protein